ncbi:MAG: right-handed parallel beta-helix repeat-containing protein [Proteobacteria bacterium]|nr:right-handed parallel beta-helix repeat-containing protein [Pseudomonadota bacterium]
MRRRYWGAWGALLGLLAVDGGRAWAARVLHVDDDNGTPQQTGSSSRPFKRIGAAIMAAANGDTIRVAGGVYRENVAVSGKVLVLLGGFVGGTASSYGSGDGGDFSAREPDRYVKRIDGSAAAKAAVTLSDAGTTVLEGFAISGGRGWTAEQYSYGGGVYVDGGSPTLRDNLVEGNKSRTAGGGIHLTDTHATVADNVVRSNESEKGGGISIDGGNVTLRNNVIRDNVAFGDHGGGLIASGPKLEIVGNRFVRNEVGRQPGYGWGGGLIVHAAGTTVHLAGNVVTENYAPSAGSGEFIDDGAEALIEHELIYRNRCPTDGGAGLYVDGLDESGPGSKVTLVHVTVADHPCKLKLGDGLYVEHKSSAVIRNSIFAGQETDFFVDDSSTLEVEATRTRAVQPGRGNLTADCLFANAAGGDYRLRSKRGRWEQPPGAAPRWVRDTQHSPCIDAAAATAPFEREGAPNGGRANLGFDGNTERASKSDDGSGGGADGSVGAVLDGGLGPGGSWGDARSGPGTVSDAGVHGSADAAGPRPTKSGCALGAGERGPGAWADTVWIAVTGFTLARRRQRRVAPIARESTSR